MQKMELIYNLFFYPYGDTAHLKLFHVALLNNQIERLK